MAIFRGVGGAGTASDNAFLLEISEASEAAQAAAQQAEQSALAAVNAEVSSATFNTSDGVLTLTKTGGATVTADLDGRFLTSYTETNDLSTAVTWANVPDANITETSVTQHLTAANVTSPLTGGTGISIASNGTITNDSPDQTVALTGTGATTITGTYPNFTINSTNTTYTVGDGGLTTNDFTDADHSKLDGIEALADVTDTANVTSAGAAMLDSSPTFTGTITAPNVDISTTGTVTTNIATGTGGLGNTKTLNLGTGYGFGGITTVNIGSSTANSINTINLNGNVAVDGTLNGGTYERTVRTRFQRRGYSNTISLYTLATSYGQLGDSLRIDSGVTTAVENVLDLNMNVTFNDINSSNEAMFVVTVDAPNPANETTVNLGTATATLGSFSVSGDFTKHFSPYCGMSVNSDGSNAFNFSNQQGWAYNPATNTTTVYLYPYQSNTPSTGDTVYLHPFDWETSGTEINGDEYPIEAYNASGTVHQNQFHQIYLGYYKPERTFKIKAKESTSSENVQINRVAGSYSQIIGS